MSELDVKNEKIRELGRTIKYLEDKACQTNIELDAMLYVWCSGGCTYGVSRFSDVTGADLTEEIVQTAERNTKRLRQWIDNREYRKQYEKGPSK